MIHIMKYVLARACVCGWVSASDWWKRNFLTPLLCVFMVLAHRHTHTVWRKLLCEEAILFLSTWHILNFQCNFNNFSLLSFSLLNTHSVSSFRSENQTVLFSWAFLFNIITRAHPAHLDFQCASEKRKRDWFENHSKMMMHNGYWSSN